VNAIRNQGMSQKLAFEVLGVDILGSHLILLEVRPASNEFDDESRITGGG
jgi:hypothetical protein